jgi:hypothetical protein
VSPAARRSDSQTKSADSCCGARLQWMGLCAEGCRHPRGGTIAHRRPHMNHDDIDPSLRAAEPLRESLDDGFSPPAAAAEPPAPLRQAQPRGPAEPALGAKSPF